MKKLFALLMTTLSILAFGTTYAQAEAKPKVIRLGSAYSAGYGKPYSGGIIGIVHAKGLLEEEFKSDGIKFEWSFFKGAGPATNESLANKTIDFAYIGDLPAIVGRAGGLKTKFIAGGSKWANVYIAVPNDSTITSINDLKGKKVGLFKGTNAQLTFARILEANGLTEKDLRIYNLGIADGEAALKTKDIDAGVYWTGLLNLRTLGSVKIIYSTKEGEQDWRNTGGFYVTEDFANKYPEVTQRIVKVYAQAAFWGSDEKNREEYIGIQIKAGSPRAAIVEELAGRTMADVNNPTLDEKYINHYVKGLEFAKERKLIKKGFSVTDEWVDRRYLDTAFKELKLEGFWK